MIIVGKKILKPTKKSPNQHYFCSRICAEKFKHNNYILKNTKNILQKCKNCNKEFLVSLNDIKIRKKQNKNFFCSKSCSATYNNKLRNFSLEKRQLINKKISQTLKRRNYKEPRKCIICNNEIPIHKSGKTCSKICEKEFRKIRQSHAGGGYREGASRGKHGHYKGFYCDSTYELAYLIYCLDHNIKIERCKETFKYVYNNKIHTYHPDFLVNGIIVEIKNFHSELTDIKINSVKNANKKIIILYKEDLKKYLEYVANKYSLILDKNLGNNFEKLYE